MAMKIIASRNEGMKDGKNYLRAKLIADSVSDLSIEGMSNYHFTFGSIAYCIAEKSFYVLNSSGTWVSSFSGAETKEITGIPPLSIRSNGTMLLDYLISGNMEQSGTPTPTTPIQPQETGERTGNLWNGNYENGVLNTDGTLDSPNYNYNTTMYILTEEKSYTLSVVCNYNEGFRLLRVCFYDANKNFISCVDSPTFKGESLFYKFNFTAPANSKYLRFSYIFRTPDTNIMLNLGSEALPYENFGYKIPITSADQTNNIYLGEVETTRRIKKVVLTGEENWIITLGKFYYTAFPLYPINWLAAITSHFEVREDISATGCARFGGTETVPQNSFNFNYDNGVGGIASWKSYLAQQYANGTPVTVWYVLATPETAVVNEPLRKIGDYADTISMEQAGVQIPTNRGNTVIDVETTLKPSQMYIEYQK